MRLYLLGMSEAIPVMPHQHDCLSMTRTSRYARVDGGKVTRLQPYIYNYRQEVLSETNGLISHPFTCSLYVTALNARMLGLLTDAI